ncbi:MAG: shikimate dehydrogenase [Ruminococcus sp.]|nr:shikimate dehydrogenase [Ruminococcus sp.]MBR2282937.1 shikimate dehydrogenase [Ruminococcus sp.]
MNKYGLIGYPLGHSMSPLIHERLFALSGITAEYSLIEIKPKDMEREMNGILRELDGFNVTIPHKVDVIPFMTAMADSAKRYSSVNCVKNSGGSFTGYNTDCDGFLRSAELLPLSGKVLLVGCGGVGRMIAIEAALAGAELTIAIIPEDTRRAQLLMAEIIAMKPGASVRIIGVREMSGSYDLCINATPVGMYPKTDACPVNDEIIQSSRTFFDVIYNPTETQLIRRARELGKTAVGGAAMLVYQAVKAHEIWYGGEFSPEDVSGIIRSVEQAVAEMNRK